MKQCRTPARVSACRRELNSHDAAEPRDLSPQGMGQYAARESERCRPSARERMNPGDLVAGHGKDWKPCGESRQRTAWEAGQFSQSRRAAAFSVRHSAVPLWRLEHVVREQQQRGAGDALPRRTRLPWFGCVAPRRCGQGALPNPSFKRTANGASPWPRSRVGYHRLRGQGATPLAAA